MDEAKNVGRIFLSRKSQLASRLLLNLQTSINHRYKIESVEISCQTMISRLTCTIQYTYTARNIIRLFKISVNFHRWGQVKEIYINQKFYDKSLSLHHISICMYCTVYTVQNTVGIFMYRSVTLYTLQLSLDY